MGPIHTGVVVFCLALDFGKRAHHIGCGIPSTDDQDIDADIILAVFNISSYGFGFPIYPQIIGNVAAKGKNDVLSEISLKT
jgi:hypothetical protein